MSPEILYLIGTLCTWIGAVLLLAGVFKAIRLWISSPTERAALQKSMVSSLIWGGVLVLLSLAIPMELGRPAGAGIRIPLVWMAMPLPAWLFLGAIGMVIARLVQGVTGISAAERNEKLIEAAVWLAGALACAYWARRTEEPIDVLRGAAFVPPLALLGTLGLAVAAVFVMVATEKAVRSRGLAKGVVTQLTLLAGCVVFGLPFVWLMVTSFKEERDMSTADGLVWVPKVQLTHDFNDPEKPLALVRYRGQEVRASIVELQRGGSLLMEIERPYGLRGRRFEVQENQIRRIPRPALVFSADKDGRQVEGFVVRDEDDGSRVLEILRPPELKGQRIEVPAGKETPVRQTGLRLENYPEAIEWMPAETMFGLRYLQNTLILVVMSVIGTLLSCSFVAYGFSRLKFPGKDLLFMVMLATMMLPGAVTMLPTFLIFRQLGWIDTLNPIWVPTFFAGAFNVFLLRQFFGTIPMELEDAAKIDGSSYLRTYWQVMLPLIKPALAAIAIWTFMGAWNNFMGPLIYISSPENMPIAYALQLFQSERGGSFGLMMAFAAMATVPVLVLFFIAQRWFIEGVQLSGLGGR